MTEVKQGEVVDAPVALAVVARRELAPAETAAAAVAAQAEAMVKARYVMAERKPRDLDAVRQKLLHECKRPAFAEVAKYDKPIGRGVQGPSIRFAEAAIRCMTNIDVQTSIVYDDEVRRQIRVNVTDLESNSTYSTDVMVEKTVERSSLRDGQVAQKVRTNSYGKAVYIVEATEDDLLNKINAQLSKAIRTNGLRHLPGDILEEAMTQVDKTLADRAAKDPDAERKRILDGFAALGVPVSELKAYVGHELGTLSPAELTHLRGLYSALKDGEVSWSEAVETKAKGAPTEKKADAKKGIEGLTDKLAGEKATKQPAAA